MFLEVNRSNIFWWGVIILLLSTFSASLFLWGYLDRPNPEILIAILSVLFIFSGFFGPKVGICSFFLLGGLLAIFACGYIISAEIPQYGLSILCGILSLIFQPLGVWLIRNIDT